jgi:hypothetical protein
MLDGRKESGGILVENEIVVMPLAYDGADRPTGQHGNAMPCGEFALIAESRHRLGTHLVLGDAEDAV